MTSHQSTLSAQSEELFQVPREQHSSSFSPLCASTFLQQCVASTFLQCIVRAFLDRYLCSTAVFAFVINGSLLLRSHSVCAQIGEMAKYYVSSSIIYPILSSLDRLFISLTYYVQKSISALRLHSLCAQIGKMAKNYGSSSMFNPV